MKRKRFQSLGIYTTLIIFSLAMILPVYILLKVSISEPEEVNTAHPTFLVQDATFDHWLDILTTEKKTDTGLMIYRIEGDTYSVEDVDGNEHTLTMSNQFTINGVFKKISFINENKEIKLDRQELQDLRDHLTTKRTFFGQKVIENLYQPLGKSFIVATVTTVVAIFICAPAAYVISRLPSYIGYIVVLSLLVTRMFPDVGIALPVATRFLSWGMTDTSIGLILAHLIPNLPFLAWILVGTFSTIPKDLEQSAMIDGANRITALTRVVFPIAIPGIAVGSIFVWLNSWNEFIYARYLSTEVATLPLRIFEVITRGSIFPAAAYSMILTIPVIIITFILQRYMKSGMLSGAVKG